MRGKNKGASHLRALANRVTTPKSRSNTTTKTEKRHMKKPVIKFLWIVNLLVAVGLLFCTCSTYLNPAKHSILSLAGLLFPVFLALNVCFIILWLFVSTRHVLLSLAACLFCIMSIRSYIPWNPGRTGAPGKSIKLLSYNVMGFDKDGGWSEDNPNPIWTYLQNSGADVICLQEAAMNDKDRRKYLNAYPYYEITSVGDSGNVLACFSKYKIVDAEKVNNQTATNGSVAYHLKVGRDTILLINNHLQSNRLTIEDKAVYKKMFKEPEERTFREGLKLLLKKLPLANRLRGPQADSVAKLIRKRRYHGVWVCGDFNDSPVSYAHRVIADDLVDTFVESGNGIGISYNQKGFPFRIDNILVTKEWRSYKCTVDNSIHTSDHYPIWCYIKRIAP